MHKYFVNKSIFRVFPELSPPTSGPD